MPEGPGREQPVEPQDRTSVSGMQGRERGSVVERLLTAGGKVSDTLFGSPEQQREAFRESASLLEAGYKRLSEGVQQAIPEEVLSFLHSTAEIGAEAGQFLPTPAVGAVKIPQVTKMMRSGTLPVGYFTGGDGRIALGRAMKESPTESFDDLLKIAADPAVRDLGPVAMTEHSLLRMKAMRELIPRALKGDTEAATLLHRYGGIKGSLKGGVKDITPRLEAFADEAVLYESYLESLLQMIQ